MDDVATHSTRSILSPQARASLKNPSRPYTPRTTARSLFHGDDYRPGSRPSSSYTVAEQRDSQQKQPNTRDRRNDSPSASMLPPRASSSRKKKSPEVPSSPEDDLDASAALSASESHLKLVHAPVLPDDECTIASTGVCRQRASRNAETNGSDGDDPLEASLELPSQDHLQETYASAERTLQALVTLSDRSNATDAIEDLRAATSSFLHVSSFFLTSSKRCTPAPSSTEPTPAQKLCLELFDAITDAVLEHWSDSAECVVALAPCLFELCSASCADNGVNDSSGRRAATSGPQIVQLSKLLFVLSKEASNDAVFSNVEYIEAALRVIASVSRSFEDPKATRSSRRQQRPSASESAAPQAPLHIDSARVAYPMRMVIYVAGTLKNTSNAEEKTLKLLATNGAIAVLSDTLRWRAHDPALAKEVAQCLIQTTGVLRNLSVVKSYHKQFVEASVPVRLCALVPSFVNHLELMGNLSRILSKLTLHELPRAQINQDMAVNMRNLMAVVDCEQNESLSFSDEQQQQRGDSKFQDVLLIRMFFVLGNLCAGNDRNRQCIAFDCGDGVAVLLHALQYYARQYVQPAPFDSQHKSDDGRDSRQSSDVLVKLVRVLANLAINADVGARLNRDSTHLALLLEALEHAQRQGDEELMLNIVSCITNLSYYSSASSPSAVDREGSLAASTKRTCFIERYRIEITALLAPILLDRNEEAVVEATRAFGNLTRFKDVLAYMCAHKVLDCFVVLLDHSNREIVYTVCGVLMNAALDDPTRQQLLSVEVSDEDAATRRTDVRSLLLGIVECAATDDVDMTCIASKVLYNLLLPPSGSRSARESQSRSSGRFDSNALRRVVEQIVAAMDAQDDPRRTTQRVQSCENGNVASGSADKGGNGGGGEAGGDGGDDYDGRSCGWRELRLVLPQLLRNTLAS